MITWDDVRTDIDMRDLCVFESALAHEVKGIGVKRFCSKYEKRISVVKKRFSYVEFCFLLAFLEYYDPSFSYHAAFKLEGCVLSPFSMARLDIGLKGKIDLQQEWDDAMPCFRNRGFVWYEVEIAV